MPGKTALRYWNGRIKATPIERINIGHSLGVGREALVSKADLVLLRPSRDNKKIRPIRTVGLSAKKFFPYLKTLNPNFRDAARHLIIHDWLRTANRTHQLNLHIVPTLRLVQNDVGWWLIKTRLPALTVSELSSAQRREYMADVHRQKKQMKKVGVQSIWRDVFFPVIDRETGKCIAMINDFGTIHPKELTRPVTRMLMLPILQRIMGIMIQIKLRK